MHSLILLFSVSLLLILLSHVFSVGTTGVSVSARDYYYLFSVCSCSVSRAGIELNERERERELCTLLCSCRRPSQPPTLFSCRLTVVLSTSTQLFDSNFWLCVHGSPETLFLFPFFGVFCCICCCYLLIELVQLVIVWGVIVIVILDLVVIIIFLIIGIFCLCLVLKCSPNDSRWCCSRCNGIPPTPRHADQHLQAVVGDGRRRRWQDDVVQQWCKLQWWKRW